MTATLTDRYLAATVRSLPVHLQQEVRDELGASIADAVAARTDQGEPADAAERDVLEELGNPAALAAGYADRPLHLIGPKYYLLWARLLRLLLMIVPACAFFGVAIGEAVAGSAPGPIIGESVVVALTVALHLTFWVTLVFFVLERTGADVVGKWRVDDLPEPTEAGTGRIDLIASLVMLGLFAGALVWDQLRGFVPTPDAPLPVLNPGLWPWWIGLLLVVLVAEGALAIAVFARGRWTPALAAVNTVLAAAVAALGLTALLQGALFNPEFVDLVLVQNGVDGDARAVLAALVGFGIAGIAIWDAIDGWLKARRARWQG